MFNKILIVTDQANPWDETENFVRQLSSRIDPANDIIFTSGPMDVLDHSSTKFAYGSKMGIDATLKFSEESSDCNVLAELPKALEIAKLKIEIPEIVSINASLLDKGISVVVIGIDKETGSRTSQLVTKLLRYEAFQKIKFVVFVDSGLPAENLYAVLWYVTGNIDPKRDCRIIEAENALEVNHMIVDGTRKTAVSDSFGRDWPNPVLSSLETIHRVDILWPDLGLGQLIASPSQIYYALKKGEGAISV